MRCDVLKHEQFEEICAAAAIGQASSAELAELEHHAAECNACRKAYSDHLDLAARQFAAAHHPELTATEAEACLTSERFTQRFFERAEQEGIVFSRGATGDALSISPLSLPFWRRPFWRIPAWQIPRFAVAFAAIVLMAASSIYFAGRHTRVTTQAELKGQQTGPAASQPSPTDFTQRLADLNAANADLESQLQQVAAKLENADSQLSKAAVDLKSNAQDRTRLAAERDALAAQLQDIQTKLAQSESAAAATQQELAQFRGHADDLQASLVADRLQIQDLTAQLDERSAALDRERQLLALGHDVNDLMAARNLHIVDVVDTDARGKNRPAFGRIFFTEGKSLVFYAYDLNEAKIEKAGYQYRIWAKKEAQGSPVKNLGIFYSDDKDQRRWAFKCNDPVILSEIDSVFVTLEPANANPAHPKGSELMYAYLRGQPNHP